MNPAYEVIVENVWAGPPGTRYWIGRDMNGEGKLHRFVTENAPRLPRPGEVWVVRGEVREHPKYGPQTHISEARQKLPSGRLLIDFLARHPAFHNIGIGVARASALYAHFGPKLYDVLEGGQAEQLAKVEKIPAESIQPLLDAWARVSQEGRAIEWLETWHCWPGLAGKLVEIYGKDTVPKLQENPYRLMAFLPFERCDQIAKRLGISDDDPRRLTAICQHCLYQQLEDGHTVVSTKSLKAQTQRYWKPRSADDEGRAIQEAQNVRAVIVTNDLASATGIRLLEMDAMTRLDHLLSAKAAQPADADAVNRSIARFETEAGYAMNPEQKAAVTMAATQRLSVLCGGAGVGKTTVLRAVAQALPCRSYCMALTGQAAKRLREAAGVDATTIEMFLRRTSQKLGKREDPLLVVDEASMLDLQLTTRILRAMPPNSRLLLVGDPAQLPPVSFGLIFHKLVESPRVPRVELTTIQRQKESSGIPQISRSIRNGIVPEFPAFSGKGFGVSFIRSPREKILEQIIDLKAEMPEAQILAIKNMGGVGVADLNEVFHNIHRVGKSTLPLLKMAVGEPVIFKKNVPNLNLVNGSLGTILDFGEDSEGNWRVIVDFAGQRTELESGYLEHLKLAYAITVHSAQGSQFGRVVQVVEPTQLLDRTLLYTGITRAVDQAVLVGDWGAFDRAVTEPPRASERNVLFKL